MPCTRGICAARVHERAIPGIVLRLLVHRRLLVVLLLVLLLHLLLYHLLLLPHHLSPQGGEPSVPPRRGAHPP